MTLISSVLVLINLQFCLSIDKVNEANLVRFLDQTLMFGS
jgi:hypothetical protein